MSTVHNWLLRLPEVPHFIECGSNSRHSSWNWGICLWIQGKSNLLSASMYSDTLLFISSFIDLLTFSSIGSLIFTLWDMCKARIYNTVYSIFSGIFRFIWSGLKTDSKCSLRPRHFFWFALDQWLMMAFGKRNLKHFAKTIFLCTWLNHKQKINQITEKSSLADI